MRTLFLASREISYQRLDVMLRAFQRLGQVTVVGYPERTSLIKRSLQVSLRAIPHLLSNQYDLVYVGFYGHLIMLPAGFLSRRPILFDAFVSTYDTLCFDRHLFAPKSFAGKAAYQLDSLACRLAQTVLLDTEQHVDYFRQTFNLPQNKLASLPVGCNEELFHPLDSIQPGSEFRILYYCTYMPLHGADIVARAALALHDLPINFKMIGTGPQFQFVQEFAREHHLTNIEFTPDIPVSQLPAEIAIADICLGGHFGVSDKSRRVIPGKIYQILAMAKPLIATDTPANAELLTSQVDSWLCQPNDPDSLAQAIIELYRNKKLRDQLGGNGYLLYKAKCSEGIITQKLNMIISGMDY